LGVALFYRNSKGIILTEYGLLFYSYALKQQQDYEKMRKDIHNINHPQIKSISIGTSCVTSKNLPSLIYKFKKAEPGVHFSIDVATPQQQLTKLEKQIFDFIMVSAVLDGLDEKQHVVHEIGYHDFIFIAAKSGMWKDVDEISLLHLPKYPLVVRERGATGRMVLEKLVKKYGVNLETCNVVCEMNSIDVIIAAVISGMGIAVVPRLLVEDILAVNNLKVLYINELCDQIIRVPFQLIHLKNKEPQNVTKKFINYIHHSSCLVDKKTLILVNSLLSLCGCGCL